MNYKYASNPDGGHFTNQIMKIEESGVQHCIPNDPANRDWQSYQAWLAADPVNQPLSADA